MSNPFLVFLDLLFTVLYFAILARVLLSWVRVDPNNQLVEIIYQITDPILEPLRRVIPMIDMGGMSLDISPIVALILLELVQRVLRTLLLGYY